MQTVMTAHTAQGELTVIALGHGSLQITFGEQVIYVDPYSQVTAYEKLPKADQIWITHEHHDHLDSKAIDAVATPDTVYVSSKAAAAALSGEKYILANGESAAVRGITITAVPAYNIERERSPGVKYHPKGVGNGYVADFSGVRVYIAGDTEHIPEMAGLRQIDLAFLPILLPYTMSPQEAAAAARSFSPAVLVPYHQGHTDPHEVQKELADSRIEVKLAGE